MNPPTRPTRARRRSRSPLRRFLFLGLLLTPILGALTFFGLVLASQAAFGLGAPSAGLQQLAQEWLGFSSAPAPPTPAVQPTATPDFGPTSAPGLAQPTAEQTASPELAVSPTAEPPTLTPNLAPSATPTPTVTETASPIPSATPSPTATPTQISTQAPSVTSGPAWTPSRTPTRTPTRTPSRTPTRTPTRTPSPVPASATPSLTLTTDPSVSPPVPSATSTAPTATLPAPTATPDGACSPGGNSGFEATLLDLINTERESQDLAPYSAQGQLQAAARGHAADMACNHFFSHTGSDGSNVGQRVNAQGYDWSWVGENILATGNTSSSAPQQAFDWWMNSAPHRANLLSPNYTEIGLGYVYLAGSDYGGYFVAVFARP